MFDYRRYRVTFRSIDDATFTYQTLTCFDSLKAVALAAKAHYIRSPNTRTADDIYEVDGVVTRVARELGIGSESLRNWLRPAEIDGAVGQGRRAWMQPGSRSSSVRTGSCVARTTS
jgi:hypothetical protein